MAADKDGSARKRSSATVSEGSWRLNPAGAAAGSIIAADRNRHAGMPAPLGMKIRCGHFQGNVRAPVPAETCVGAAVRIYRNLEIPLRLVSPLAWVLRAALDLPDAWGWSHPPLFLASLSRTPALIFVPMQRIRGFRRFGLALAGAFMALGAGALLAEDWPQWLGPNRDSVWGETGILERFPSNGPPVRWRADVGAGYSGPIVAKGRVYLTDRPKAADGGKGNERVLCLDEATGKTLWHYEYECPYAVSYPAGPRAAPLVNADKVYTLGAEGNLYCLKAQDGTVVWSHDFKKEFGIKAPTWGWAGHPLLDGNRLICLAGGAGTTAMAFDQDTGKEIWRALTAGEPGYSSPVIFQAGGKRQLILWHPEAVNSLDPATGEVYWSVPFRSKVGLCIATPRKLEDKLFVTSFYNGSLMLQLDAARPAATPIWQTQKETEMQTTHLNAIICTPFLEGGYIYGVCSYGQLRCLKAETGERVWETFQATTSGGPVRWANLFIVKNGSRFFLFNEKGDLIIAKLSPRGYEEISRAHLLETANADPGRPVVWSHPAFANRCVFARNDKEIICADLAQP
jgi:outer membrane protein assembly factor BamB